MRLIASAIMRASAPFVLALVLTGCAVPPPEPFLGGDITGSYDGAEFAGENGFATMHEGSAIVLLGDGNLYCGAEDASDPPDGRNALLDLPAFEVGTYSNVLVRMYENIDSFEGVGTNSGSVTVTEVTETSVAGEVAFSYTDEEGRDFSLSGTFDVVRCAE